MAQSLSQLYVHIIFSTKKRAPFLQGADIQQRVHNYIKGICHQQQCESIIVGGMEDHIHILTCLKKNMDLSKLIEEIKHSSSKWIKSLATSDNQLDQFYWQRGYGAFTVSESMVDIVSRYIENQEIMECFRGSLSGQNTLPSTSLPRSAWECHLRRSAPQIGRGAWNNIND